MSKETNVNRNQSTFEKKLEANLSKKNVLTIFFAIVLFCCTPQDLEQFLLRVHFQSSIHNLLCNLWMMCELTKNSEKKVNCDSGIFL